MEKTTLRLATAALALVAASVFNGCMAQNARTSRVERRQDRMDNRFEGRMERREIRAEREDARARRSWDAMMN
jgi:hypothetical protein